MKIKELAKAWTIRYTRPKNVAIGNGEPRIYHYNYCSVIIAETVLNAVESLLKQCDDATIISVNPGSTGPIVIDERSIDDSSV